MPAAVLPTAKSLAVFSLKPQSDRLLGASGRFSFGSAALMAETLGIKPGAVTPFGAINDTQGRVSVVLDKALMEHETVNAHPLVNTMTTSLRSDDLVKFLDFTGHPPRIERISGLASSLE